MKPWFFGVFVFAFFVSHAPHFARFHYIPVLRAGQNAGQEILNKRIIGKSPHSKRGTRIALKKPICPQRHKGEGAIPLAFVV